MIYRPGERPPPRAAPASNEPQQARGAEAGNWLRYGGQEVLCILVAELGEVLSQAPERRINHLAVGALAPVEERERAAPPCALRIR